MPSTATYKITALTSLAVATPGTPSPGRTFAVQERGRFVRRRVSAVGYGDGGDLTSRNLGGGQYAHYDLVATPDEATEFSTRHEAGLLHLELAHPGHATIVCVDRY